MTSPSSLASLDRWLHIVSGVFWIGLLYYFNVVQIPGLAAGLADKGGPGNAGIIKYIAPRALLWFRWGAVVTVLSGVMLMEFTYGGGGLMKGLAFREGFETIGVGGWLGIIMLFNVWVLHLAEPEEGHRRGAGHRRGEGQGPGHGHHGFPHQLHPLHPHADGDGRPVPRPAVLSAP